uniref:DUF4942 domain-containing protein n=1 Tax=Meloidogyne hapla TaxID=6305 RepID=A0A1I8B9R0_MELHA
MVLNIDFLVEYFEGKHGYYDPSIVTYSEEVTTMHNFVKAMQLELGWKERFRPTTKLPSPLNFEKDYESREKYEGPFEIITDSLIWLPNLFNKVNGPTDFEVHISNFKSNKEILEFIIKKLKTYAENEWKWSPIDFKNMSIPLIHWACAYLCDMGKNTECQITHKSKGRFILDHVKSKMAGIEPEKVLKDSINASSNSMSWEEKFDKEVGNVVHLAIVEFNERMIENNVKEAVLEAMKNFGREKKVSDHIMMKVSDPIMIPK